MFHVFVIFTLRSLSTIPKTRLNSRIIEHYHGEIQEQTDGKNTVLVFNQGIETHFERCPEKAQL